MRFGTAHLLWASIVPVALAILADDAYNVDYHYALLGTPGADTTFFHRPSISSSASLLYTLSESHILGAVNPKDGNVVWRQNLSDYSTGALNDGFLRAADGSDVVVSALANDVSSWGAADGKLSWTARFADGPVNDLALLESKDNSAGETIHDSVVLFGDKQGVVRRLDGKSGKVTWEYRDDSDDIPFQVSTSGNAAYYISLQSVSRRGYKIKELSLDLQTGRPGKQNTLNAESEASTPESIIFVGESSAAPLIAWTDKSLSVLKINIIGSKDITTVNIDNSGDKIHKVRIHASDKENSPAHFMVHYQAEQASWAEAYHVDSKTKKISKSYNLPRQEGRSVIATSFIENILCFSRISASEISVHSSTSDAILGKWTPSELAVSNAKFAIAEVVSRGVGVAIRFAQVEDSGDWSLVRNGELGWSRPESLTNAVAAAWADINGGEALAHELEVEGHQSISMAYIHRLKRHAIGLQENLPGWLTELPLRVLSSFLPSDGSEFTEFGFGQIIVLATRGGRVATLDSGRHGKVIWNIKAAETDTDWDVKTITTQNDIATIYVNDGSLLKLNISTGEITERTAPAQKLASVALVGDDTSSKLVGVGENGVPITVLGTDANEKFVVTRSDDRRILGWRASKVDEPIWEFSVPEGQKIIHATSRPEHDPVASIGKVLGDRSVLYKYLNPNLALVTAAGDSRVTFYLLDGTSGQVLHTVTHSDVDTKQPIASVISENWFAYSFWSDISEKSDSKGYQLVISELYESSLPNDRGSLGDAANYSSIRSDIGVSRPHVISQAFMIPESISNMAVTQTRQGITIRELLCTLPSSNAIVGIPRPILDPRRPVGRDPTAKEVEEGLMKYSPVLEFDPRWYLTHSREVLGINHVESRPTLLESSTLIFSYGFDLFGSRVSPSQPFDLLGKGFSKIQLLLTVVALAAGVAVLSPMARAKQVNLTWKST